MSGYSKTAWANGAAPAISAGNLGKLETADEHALGVDTVAALKALPIPTFATRCWLRGYDEVNDGGGGVFDWDATCTDADDAGITLLPAGHAGPGRWVRNFSGPIHVKWFGAKGDGVTNDRDALARWLSSGGALLGDAGEYLFDSPLGAIPVTNNIVIDGNGMNLTAKVGAAGDHHADDSLINLQVAEGVNLDIVSISRFNIDCGGEYLGGIIVRGMGANTPHVSNVSMTDNKITHCNNPSHPASSTGMRCSILADAIEIKHNVISNITRVQVNPGVVASTGIYVSDTEGLVTIEDNVISNISSPAGDSDADGITVKYKDWATAANIKQSVGIQGNVVTECKGRWIKLQTSKARIHDNYFANLHLSDAISDFRGIDAQVGGVNIFNNVLVQGSQSGASSMSFIKLDMRNDIHEAASVVHNNTLYVKKDVPYFVILAMYTGGIGDIKIHDNIITSVDAVAKIASIVHAIVTEDFARCNLSVTNNMFASGSGQILTLTPQDITTDPVKGPVFSGKFSLTVADNENTIASGSSGIISSSASGFPFLQKIKLSGNKGYARGVSIQGCDVLLLEDGNNFGYLTDGGAGGLLNAPAVHDRYMHVVSDIDTVVLTRTNGASFVVVKKSNGTGHKYDGVVIP